jgi:hypothetical protein
VPVDELAVGLQVLPAAQVAVHKGPKRRADARRHHAHGGQAAIHAVFQTGQPCDRIVIDYAGYSRRGQGQLFDADLDGLGLPHGRPPQADRSPDSIVARKLNPLAAVRVRNDARHTSPSFPLPALRPKNDFESQDLRESLDIFDAQAGVPAMNRASCP